MGFDLLEVHFQFAARGEQGDTGFLVDADVADTLRREQGDMVCGELFTFFQQQVAGFDIFAAEPDMLSGPQRSGK